MHLNKHTDEKQLPSNHPDVNVFASSLGKRWQELCLSFLPLASKDRKWRYSRVNAQTDLKQGWKLHISANVLTACEVLQKIAPFLRTREVLFKGPYSLEELMRINSGLYYGYSQIGKFITIYPRNDEEAVFLARRLHKLTGDFSAPAVPFDLEFRQGSCVFYRYGAFEPIEMENSDGTRIPAIWHPDGHLIPDLRDAHTAKLEWLRDPFFGKPPRRSLKTVDTPLKTTFRVFRALTQRGKGGVYQALDLSVYPPRLCILKEGRKDGEVSWDGRDGAWRVRNEERVLYSLQDAGIKVPRIYSAFEAEGNYYLVTEFIEGDNLQVLLSKRHKRLTIPQVLQYAIQLSLLISQIQAAGWVWRDCKPSNLLVTHKGEFRPLDFEGACPVDQPDPLMWGTPDFSPPVRQDTYGVQSRVPEDSYAIGAITYFLLTGRILAASNPLQISELRRNTPSFVCEIISELLALDPAQRPDALATAHKFRAALSAVETLSKTPNKRVRSSTC